VSDFANKTSNGGNLPGSENASRASLSIQDIMHELKHAVEAQAGTLHQLTEAHAELDSEPAAESLKLVIEVVSALARQCEDSDHLIHEKVLALDEAVKFLVGQSESTKQRLALIADLETAAESAAAENQRQAGMVADLFAQHHQLQAKVARWQSESSNDALKSQVDALSARVALIETRTECLGEIKSDVRRSSVALSTMAEDIQILFGQLNAASKQLNSTMTRLEGFRRHFEQLPD
jgi:hypothetical protein